MQMTQDHVRALDDLMRWRRDTRHFRTDPLPAHLLETLRAAMDQAPSVGNARPWRVIRVCDPELRAAVRAEFERCNRAAAAAYDAEQRAEYMKLKLAGLDAAPEHLAVFTDMAPQAGRGLGRQTLPQTLEQSTSMAIYALWLTARAHNLGVGMVSILDGQRLQDLFEMPQNMRFSAYLCLGYPDFTDHTPLLHRVDWQKNSATVWEDR